MELDVGQVPYKRSGQYLRQVLGKIIKLEHFPIGHDDWRYVSDLDKADCWNQLI